MGQGRDHKRNQKIFSNDNKNKTFQNLQFTAKAVLRELSTALNACIRKEERYRTNDLSSHFNKSETKRAN